MLWELFLNTLGAGTSAIPDPEKGRSPSRIRVGMLIIGSRRVFKTISGPPLGVLNAVPGLGTGPSP